MDNTNFINSDGHIIKTSSMRDEHQLIKIIEKTAVLGNIGKIVRGDINSNILTFEINRYYDGVDLYTKAIKFIIKNDLGIFTEDAVNLQYNSEFLRFSWVLSAAVTYKSGDVSVAIIFTDAESELNYALKTVPFTITIDNSLDFLDSKPPYKNWFEDTKNKFDEIESAIQNLNNLAHSHENKNILDSINSGIPTKLSQLENDCGFTDSSESDELTYEEIMEYLNRTGYDEIIEYLNKTDIEGDE